MRITLILLASLILVTGCLPEESPDQPAAGLEEAARRRLPRLKKWV